MKTLITHLMVMVFAVFVMAGCSSTNPYQRTEQVDVPINKLATQATQAGADSLAGNLHGAIAALKDQRREWYESLSTQARVRTVTQLSVLGLSAGAIYSGLKSGVASDSDKKRLALAGALGFTAFAAGDWFANPSQEVAYTDGIHALTCAMLTIEPLRFGTASFSLMASEQLTLTRAINGLDEDLLEAQATFRYPSTSDSPQALVRREAAAALSRARKTLASSHQLYREIDNSGVTLMREGDLVFGRVAERIRAGSKAVTAPGVFASDISGMIGKFRSIAIEQKNENEAKDKPASDDSPGLKREGDVVGGHFLNMTLPELKAAINKEIQADGNICGKSGNADCVATELAGTAERLAKKTAAVYAARRPLSNRLLAFFEARRAVEKNRSCAGPGSSMSVSPSTDAEVTVGQQYSIAVSGVATAPIVVVKGMAKHELLVGLGANQYVVRVAVDANAKGAIDVSISDGGRLTEDITLTVQEKEVDKK